MLMALLYDDNDRLVAAAPACDHHVVGDRYWRDVFEGELNARLEDCSTGYVEVLSSSLQSRLLDLGIDQKADSGSLALEVAFENATQHRRDAA